ncbi:I78 family peptidase inhibitor [Acidovorax sp. ACV01]|uniref:I78 family peptidase inhibitor n=1 Tax=Acidovorax sp. ACV01 TaxID=2769311 RepID=UPI00177C4AF4|nr:I78 family peptidase inhibitor [Acidovorax sp. ACV01]MBD9393314.1 proteinase inhibitor I78 [Acidovorax sp. ACV01]
MTNIPFAAAGGLVVAALLTGCANQGQPPAPSGGLAAAPSAPGGLCNAQPAQSAVGQNSTASVVESARVRSGAQMARILRPGQIITKEFDAQRLNLEVDGNGRILAVRCG